MDFREWEPYYEQIRQDMGYSREEDERSAQLLSRLCKGKWICRPDCLQLAVKGEVTVVGHSPALEEQLDDLVIKGTLISADGATAQLMERGLRPDIVMTDLDGDMGPELRAGEEGGVLVVLAHGDNIPEVEAFVPLIGGPMTPTTQVRPFGDVYNFGGFTDGDRGVMLARHFGAGRINLIGFDFEVPRPKPGRDPKIKRKKLEWAKRIIFEIAANGAELSIP